MKNPHGPVSQAQRFQNLEPSMIGDPWWIHLQLLWKYYRRGFFLVFQIVHTVPNKLLGVLLRVSVLTIPFLKNVNKFQNPFCRQVATTIFLIGTVVALWFNVTYREIIIFSFCSQTKHNCCILPHKNHLQLPSSMLLN